MVAGFTIVFLLYAQLIMALPEFLILEIIAVAK